MHASYLRLGLLLTFLTGPMIASKSLLSRVAMNRRHFKTALQSAAFGTDLSGTLHKERMSHYDFFNNRKWYMAEQFWSDIVRDSTVLKPFVEGDDKFGVTDLKAVNSAGMRGEFMSKDMRYSAKRTYALRIGYVGTLYNGYQKQNNVPDVYTIEDDLQNIFGCLTYGAGRTDADVSAVSQVISLTGRQEETAEDLLQKMRLSDPVQSGRLAVYSCERVPKKFNSRSCATWRRYLYLLPLNEGSFNGFDIDIDFVNEALNR